MQSYALVFLGAGFGGMLRHGVNIAMARALGTGFPWWTLAVNVAGSFAMGLLAGWLAARLGAGWSEQTKLFLGTGILGGFTTFSAFSLDVATLWARGETLAAGAYVAASVAGSLAAIFLGLAVARQIA